MLTYSAYSRASPETVWALISQPRQWHRWAPHLRGAIGLGHPEVDENRLGLAMLLGALPVPAWVVDKDPGRSWTWRAGLLKITHRVRPRPPGSEVTMELSAPPPFEALLAVSYGPIVAALVRYLARVAAPRAQR